MNVTQLPGYIPLTSCAHFTMHAYGNDGNFQANAVHRLHCLFFSYKNFKFMSFNAVCSMCWSGMVQKAQVQQSCDNLWNSDSINIFRVPLTYRVRKMILRRVDALYTIFVPGWGFTFDVCTYIFWSGRNEQRSYLVKSECSEKASRLQDNLDAMYWTLSIPYLRSFMHHSCTNYALKGAYTMQNVSDHINKWWGGRYTGLE